MSFLQRPHTSEYCNADRWYQQSSGSKFEANAATQVPETAIPARNQGSYGDKKISEGNKSPHSGPSLLKAGSGGGCSGTYLCTFYITYILRTIEH